MRGCVGTGCWPSERRRPSLRWCGQRARGESFERGGGRVGAMESPLCAYELQRLETIRRNQEVLRALGLAQTMPKVQLAATRKRGREAATVVGTPRRSPRLMEVGELASLREAPAPVHREAAVRRRPQFAGACEARDATEAEEEDPETPLHRAVELDGLWVDDGGLLRSATAATGFKGVYAQKKAATFIVQWPRYLGCFTSARQAARAIATELGVGQLREALADAKRAVQHMTAEEALTAAAAEGLQLDVGGTGASGFVGVEKSGCGARPWFARVLGGRASLGATATAEESALRRARSLAGY